MVETTTPPKPKKQAAPRRKKTSEKSASASASSRATTPKKESTTMTETLTPAAAPRDNRAEAKSRFNAAIEEVKAGAAALKAEAGERASTYRQQAQGKSKDLSREAKTYVEEARVKGKDLATQGKTKVSEGLNLLGQTVAENAHYVDEKLGAKYGDYARSASRSIQDAATKLDNKSVDELGEDAREFVRKSPGTAIGIAAVFGFLLSRLFSGSRR